MTLGIGVLIAVAAIISTIGLPSQPVTDALFNRDSTAYKQTAQANDEFGDDPVVIVAKGRLLETVSADNVKKLNILEQCLAGRATQGRGEFFRTCKEIADLHPTRLTAGPGSFLTQAVDGINAVYQRQLDRLNKIPKAATGLQVVERQRLLNLASQIVSKYGLVGPPSLDDGNFINQVVFGLGQSRKGQPKPKLSYLFPNDHAAQIVVRLRSDLTDSERSRTIDLFRKAVDDPAVKLSGSTYVISGSPVVLDGLSETLINSVIILAAIALVLMALALVVVFGSTWRLLPLGMALAAAAITLGLLRLFGGSVSLAAVGVLPILIGLAVDYAVQIQARYDEADPDLEPVEAARIAASEGLPMIATACLATAFGFAALILSDLPLVSDFGFLLAAGVLVSLLVVFLLGFAALALRGPGKPAPARIRNIFFFDWIRRGVESMVALSVVAPGRILVVSLVVAACGWAASTQASTEADVNQVLPSRASAVKDFNDVESSTGFAGEIDLIVRSKDVTAPETVGWMREVRDEALARAGYRTNAPDCETADLCPGPSIPDFIAGTGAGVTSADNRSALEALPADQLKGIVAGGVSGDKPATVAKIPFAIRKDAVDHQDELIDDLKSAIAESRDGQGPPDGVTVQVTGLPVVVSSAVDDLASNRFLLIGAGILAVALILLLIYRDIKRVLVPLVPILIAGGWSAMIVSALDLSLNPLSSVLAVLVTAIATEFSVILAARYYQERAIDKSIGTALRGAYGSTGMAIAASGVTAIAGFVSLGFSDIPMLRDFGLIAVVDLSVALLGVALVLPAALVWAEDR